jgi:hypothetical protein
MMKEVLPGSSQTGTVPALQKPTPAGVLMAASKSHNPKQNTEAS